MPNQSPDASRRAYTSERDFEILPQNFVADAERSAEEKRQQRKQAGTGTLGGPKDEDEKSKGGEGIKAKSAEGAEAGKPAAKAEGDKLKER